MNYIEDFSIPGRLQEIAIKTARVRQMLEQSGNEALFLYKHPNFSWITAGAKNFVANCFDAGAAAVLITHTASYVFCNIIEQPRLVQEELLPDLGFEVMYYGWEEDRMLEMVSKHVHELSHVVSDIPMGGMRFDSSLINPLRLCLTDNEVARYFKLGHLLSTGLEEAMAGLHPGMTELEIAGVISQRLWQDEVEQVMHLVCADERSYSFRHALPTSKKAQHSVIASINGRYRGLIATVSRMVCFGEPSQAFVQQYNDCVEMECMAIAKARVGADELEMYNALKQAYLDKGYPTMFERHGQGGCQGYFPRDYMVTPQSHHIIRQNQAYCFNPVVDGTKSEDSFIVTAQGPQFITLPVSYPTISLTVEGIDFVRPSLKIIA